MTRTIAQRGSGDRAARDRSASAAADQYSQHFAIVLDNQIVTQPIINFVDNPDGIDGRTGAQISGNFTIGSAQDLAKFLKIGALPVNLALISQSTVSATLGQQALDQGLQGRDRRPGAGRACSCSSTTASSAWSPCSGWSSTGSSSSR